MVVNDLEQVVFAIFEDHINAFVLEKDLNEMYDVGMGKFCAERHLTNG